METEKKQSRKDLCYSLGVSYHMHTRTHTHTHTHTHTRTHTHKHTHVHTNHFQDNKAIHTKCLRLLSQTQTCSQAYTSACKLSLLQAPHNETYREMHTHTKTRIIWSCAQLVEGEILLRRKSEWTYSTYRIYGQLVSHGMLPFLFLSFPFISFFFFPRQTAPLCRFSSPSISSFIHVPSPPTESLYQRICNAP